MVRSNSRRHAVDLSQLPIFEGVHPDLLNDLGVGEERYFADGDVIFSEGAAGTSMFVVLHGQVAITRDDIHLVTRQANDVIGEQACIEGADRSATTIAIGSVRLLEIPRATFDKLLKDPQFSHNLMGVLSKKLRGASEERAFRYGQEQALFSEFRAHVAPEVLNELLAKGTEEYGDARFTDAIILMSDIRDFSTRSAELAPEAIAGELGAYLDAIVDVIHRRGGLVDKFVGDAVMAVWGGFEPTGEDLALQAFMCASAMVSTARKMSFGGQPIAIGVELNAGRVFMGNIGSDGKRQFTVLGTPVNAAARLEAKSKEFGAPIVIGSDLYERLPPTVQRRFQTHPDVELKGVGMMTCYTCDLIAEEAE